MAVYEVRALAKNHWWNFSDEVRSKTVAPHNEAAVATTRQFWRNQGVKYFKLISVKKIED